MLAMRAAVLFPRTCLGTRQSLVCRQNLACWLRQWGRQLWRLQRRQPSKHNPWHQQTVLPCRVDDCSEYGINSFSEYDIYSFSEYDINSFSEYGLNSFPGYHTSLGVRLGSVDWSRPVTIRARVYCVCTCVHDREDLIYLMKTNRVK